MGCRLRLLLLKGRSCGVYDRLGRKEEGRGVQERDGELAGQREAVVLITRLSSVC